MQTERNLVDYCLEYIFTCTWTVTEAILGPCPQGFRVNTYVTQGEVTGPKVQGTIRPGDGNWATLHSNGVISVDYRLTFETHDGALIGAACIGRVDVGEDAAEKSARGEALPRFRALRWGIHCHTAHPSYLWLNRVHCLGIGQFDSQHDELTVDVYMAL
ncbi:MAG: DUF3237 domain-containing protein [Chloroflexota bacterium]|nr:DUF3237 domain-containing protein [Chloroflexota bacterium]